MQSIYLIFTNLRQICLCVRIHCNLSAVQLPPIKKQFILRNFHDKDYLSLFFIGFPKWSFSYRAFKSINTVYLKVFKIDTIGIIRPLSARFRMFKPRSIFHACLVCNLLRIESCNKAGTILWSDWSRRCLFPTKPAIESSWTENLIDDSICGWIHVSLFLATCLDFKREEIDVKLIIRSANVVWNMIKHKQVKLFADSLRIRANTVYLFWEIWEFIYWIKIDFF